MFNNINVVDVDPATSLPLAAEEVEAAVCHCRGIDKAHLYINPYEAQKHSRGIQVEAGVVVHVFTKSGIHERKCAHEHTTVGELVYTMGWSIPPHRHAKQTRVLLEAMRHPAGRVDHSNKHVKRV